MKKIVIIVFIIFVIIVVININQKDEINSISKNETSSEIMYEFDEQTSEYVIYNKQTGEEIVRVLDKESLDFYINNPDYNPKLNAEDPDFIDNAIIQNTIIE